MHRGPLLLAGEWHGCFCDAAYLEQANGLLGAPAHSVGQVKEGMNHFPAHQGPTAAELSAELEPDGQGLLWESPVPQIDVLVGIRRGNS